MPSLIAYIAPLALMLPFMGQGAVLVTAQAPDHAESAGAPYSPAFPMAADTANPLDAFHGRQVWRQFRIEQRVIIRISPQPETNRNSLLAQLPRQGLNTRFEEREMERCLPVNRISGVQTGNGNRLLLFLNDKRIVSVNLERACRAREFYSGFYVEKSEDGQICVDRDELQSRSGARCEVERMRQLVAVNE